MIDFTLLGHACALIEVGGTKVLCDPHLLDDFGNELYTVYPPRRVLRERMPSPDVVFLSHHHRDHFDVRSLAMLRRDTPMICPKDDEIGFVLHRLGFSDVNVIDDGHELEIGGARFVFTGSRYETRENGLLVIDDDAVLWSMVDTIVDAEIVASVRAAIGDGRGIDALLWSYQPLVETQAFESQSLAFPTSKLEHLAATLRLLRPRAVIPYADGQFGAGVAGWFNAYRFPVGGDDAREIAAHAAPDAAFVTMQPGDRVRVSVAGIERAGRADFVQILPHAARDRAYDKTQPVPDVASGTPAALRRVREGDDLVARLQLLWTSANGEPAFRQYMRNARELGVRYELALVDDTDERVVTFLPGEASLELRAPGVEGDDDGKTAVVRVHAGVLQAILDGRVHFVTAWLGGLVRSFDRVYSLRDGRLERPRMVTDLKHEGAVEVGTFLSPVTLLNALIAATPGIVRTILELELDEALTLAPDGGRRP